MPVLEAGMCSFGRWNVRLMYELKVKIWQMLHVDYLTHFEDIIQALKYRKSWHRTRQGNSNMLFNVAGAQGHSYQ